MKLKFYGSKLNINANIFNQDLNNIKKNLIPERIKSFSKYDGKSRLYRLGKSDDKLLNPVRWTLANVTEIEDNVLSGDVVKVSKTTFDILQGVKTEPEEVDRALKIHFYYFVDDEVVIMQSNQYIHYDIGLSVLKTILSRDVNIGELDFEVYMRYTQFERELFEDTIRKITLNYVTPNDPRTLNSISDILLNNNAPKGKFELENEKDGIRKYKDEEDENKGKEKKEPTDLLSDFLVIVRSGFVSIKARVGARNHTRTISSKEYAASAKIKEDNVNDLTSVNSLKATIVSQMGDDLNGKKK